MPSVGATDLWLWRSDEGRSGEYLRRAILLPFGALLLMHAVLVVAGLTLDRGEVSWPDLLPVAIGALDLAVAVWGRPPHSAPAWPRASCHE